MLIITDRFKSLYPNAKMGIAIVENIDNSEKLRIEEAKGQLTEELIQKYKDDTKQEMKSRYPIKEYMDYYRSFKKTYHVLHQVESVAQKGKEIPHVISLVGAMFMAELKNQLLTAGHDLDKLQTPLTLDIGVGTEEYTGINKEIQGVVQNDMYLRDETGIISSILRGPDYSSRITQKTKRALFTIYAPSGIENQYIREHLEDIYGYIRLFSPGAKLTLLDIF